LFLRYIPIYNYLIEYFCERNQKEAQINKMFKCNSIIVWKNALIFILSSVLSEMYITR